ncbi:MAG: ISL3 family transposase [Clostridia bacterium]|nr:ISL3 family transposase [Clostridia bacterium]
MPRSTSKDFLQEFYPVDLLEIRQIRNGKDGIKINLKSKTHECRCHKCGQPVMKYHGTYTRNVQDLPILGKNVMLEIDAYEFKCQNPECNATSTAEDYDGFLSYYSRMTERCEDFICALALETSCEGAARICKEIGIKTSGDSIIRLLEKRFEQQPQPECGEVIGVDDFAFKKRHTYGTIIVDENTHQPVAILDGRDEKTLREWLKNNKHIKIVTRDRASAYAKAIAEELPDAMQIADRFHLHQNLLEAINKAIGREIPATIAIPKEKPEREKLSTKKPAEGKKNITHCG